MFKFSFFILRIIVNDMSEHESFPPTFWRFHLKSTTSDQSKHIACLKWYRWIGHFYEQVSNFNKGLHPAPINANLLFKSITE